MSGLLKEKGTTSTMRVAMLICTISACGVAFLGVWKDSNLIGLGVVVSGMLASGFTGKVVQKKEETK